MIALLLTRWRAVQGVIGLLAALFLFATALHYRHAYHAEIALRQADRAAVALAQAQAEAMANSEARAREVALQAHTAKIEDERNDLQDRFAALADRYRIANRVRSGADQGSAGIVPAAAEDHSTGLRAPASEASLVAITGDDFDRCTVIAGDYVKLREWAMGL